MNPVTRHVWPVARHHRFDPGHSRDICGTFRLVVRVLRLLPGRHLLERLIEEPVQGLSHSGGTGTMVGMELSASYERLDFTLAYFDAEEPQPLALTLAEPPHADGRRRARRLFCRRRLLHCPWIMIHQCTRSRGEFASSLRAEKYQNGRAVEIASYDLAQNRRSASIVAGRFGRPVGLPLWPGRKLADRHPPRDILPALAYSVVCF